MHVAHWGMSSCLQPLNAATLYKINKLNPKLLCLPRKTYIGQTVKAQFCFADCKTETNFAELQVKAIRQLQTEHFLITYILQKLKLNIFFFCYKRACCFFSLVPSACKPVQATAICRWFSIIHGVFLIFCLYHEYTKNNWLNVLLSPIEKKKKIQHLLGMEHCLVGQKKKVRKYCALQEARSWHPD